MSQRNLQTEVILILNNREKVAAYIIGFSSASYIAIISEGDIFLLPGVIGSVIGGVLIQRSLEKASRDEVE